MASEEETIYCSCRQPYDGTRFMIECDVCKDWFHGSCVDIQEYQASDIEIYHCPNCQLTQGPLVLKRRRNWHRHDYAETDDNVCKAVQTGTVKFVQELKSRAFPNVTENELIRLRGSQLTVDYLQRTGFRIPILVDKPDGLCLTLPPSNFSIRDVENHVGSMREIDVIDVARQEDYKMLMREWTEYYNSPNRTKIFNVISLEFSKTKLAELVAPPRLVSELSWVSTCWPSIQPSEDSLLERPEVQRYCLMGVKDSFTDFHIDFGGTSVWYHVLRGEKVFYLVRPTDSNLALYENWVSSSTQSEQFFGDQVDECYRCVVSHGQTLFIPTGWIHAVLTPIDSLVFGGNFLHTLNVPLQIKVYEIERRVKTPEKFMFPNFETVHWYAARSICQQIKGYNEIEMAPPTYLMEGGKSLATALKSWTHKKDYIKRDHIPDTIQYGKLLKELQKEMRHAASQAGVPLGSPETPKRSTKKSEKKKKKKRKSHDTENDDGLSHMPTKDMAHKPKKKKAKLKQKSLCPEPKVEFKTEKETFKVESPVKTSLPNLKVRLPKAGAFVDISVYDFDDDGSGENGGKKGVKPRSDGGGGGGAGGLASGIKLKVSGGKIISGGSPDKNRSPRGAGKFVPLIGDGRGDSQDDRPGDRLGDRLGDGHGDMQGDRLGDGQGDRLVDKHDDSAASSVSDTDNLVVDETPRKRCKQNKSGSALKPGSLKMRLSLNRASQSPGTAHSYPDPEHPLSPLPRCTQLSFATLHEPGGGGSWAEPGGAGAGGSITEMLEAASSMHSTVQEEREEEEGEEGLDMPAMVDATSPSMRDAIQGMLSMSRMGSGGSGGFSSPPSSSSSHPLTSPPTTEGGKYTYADDMGDRMPNCYNDDEFVYPTLDTSDNEDPHVFKPRGRQKQDETWNPKAKLTPNCAKPERPSREGARRESVESGLAAAAARLANSNTQPPKRPYIKRKPRPVEKPQPSFDTFLDSSPPSTSFAINTEGYCSPPAVKKPESPTKGKKAKKGMATAKQRLGKILKMHKMMI